MTFNLHVSETNFSYFGRVVYSNLQIIKLQFAVTKIITFLKKLLPYAEYFSVISELGNISIGISKNNSCQVNQHVKIS